MICNNGIEKEYATANVINKKKLMRARDITDLVSIDIERVPHSVRNGHYNTKFDSVST